MYFKLCILLEYKLDLKFSSNMLVTNRLRNIREITAPAILGELKIINQ